ncbi:hypothetical protein [Prescottella equi]|uniref:hypothetical protein n=1 Tax=Rhodococcus hoagii TaxID=43767 RepID=UPI000A102D96|nr:hypothetical protein [Prescottella equi]ORL83885.1 hypothetical protein A5N71_01170 [Prescottella equi]
MTIFPEAKPYTRREDADLTMDNPIHLSTDGDVLHHKEWTYKGRLVDFALNHYVTKDHPDNRKSCTDDVARIDTCHSEVHRHQFYRSGKPQNREVIKDLHGFASLEEAEKAVGLCFEECYFSMADDWQAHLDRWKEAS